MTKFACIDCGHNYGTTVPTVPAITLHRTVSHGGATPIVNVPTTTGK